MGKTAPHDDASSTFRGFRHQAIYILNRIVEDFQNKNLSFQPEGEEDLLIKDESENEQEIIQVKSYSAPLTFSILTNFFSRAIHTVQNQTTLKTKFLILSYGPIGPELTKGLSESSGKYRKSLIQKLKGLDESAPTDAVEQFLDSCTYLIVNEYEIERSISSWIRGSILGLDPEIGLDLLMQRIYKASENREWLDFNSLRNTLERFGQEISQRSSHLIEFGANIKPLTFSPKGIEVKKLAAEYYIGIAARPEHIEANLDTIRQEKLQVIKGRFDQDNLTILTGASGQGKTTLALRFLKDYLAKSPLYQIVQIESKAHANILIKVIGAIANSFGSPICLFVDVEPGNVFWVEFLKNLHPHPHVKILIAIREEDWNRSEYLIGGNLALNPVQLSFNPIEARAIYKELNSQIKAFPNFEDAWIQFGGKGPLLEFVYLLTQGRTLRDRLASQVAILRNRIKKGEDYRSIFSILRLIALADSYDSKIDVSKLKEQFDIDELKEALELLANEHLVRLIDEKTIDGLHPIRSQILKEILFDPLLGDLEDGVITALALIEERNVDIFLLNYFYESKNPEKLLEVLPSYRMKHFGTLGGIIKAIIWLGVKEYIETNFDHLNEIHEEHRSGWYFVTGFLDGPELDFFDSESGLFKPNNKKIRSRIEQLRKKLSPKKNVYDRLSSYLRVWDLTNFPAVKTSEDWKAVGRYLYWCDRFSLTPREIPTTLFNANSNDITSLKSASELIFGLHKFDPEKAYSLRGTLLEQFFKEYNLLHIEGGNQELSIHFIVRWDGTEKEQKTLKLEEKNSDIPHRQAVEIIEIAARLFPEKESFSTQGYGHIYKSLIESPYDSTRKNISRSNLSYDWYSFTNSVYINLGNRTFNSATWEDHIEAVLSFRNKVAKIWQNLFSFMEEYFRAGKVHDSFMRFIDDELMESLIADNYNFGILPIVSSDRFGLRVISQQNLIQQELDTQNRYKEYLKQVKSYSNLVTSWLKQVQGQIIAKKHFRHLSPQQKSQKIKEIKEKGLNLDVEWLTVYNVFDLVKRLAFMQKAFRITFSNLVPHAKLTQIEIFENQSFTHIPYAWYLFLNSKRNKINDLRRYIDQKNESFWIGIKTKIERGFHRISSQNINCETLEDSLEIGYKHIVFADIDNPTEILSTLNETLISLSKSINPKNKHSLEWLRLNLYIEGFQIIPIVSGNALNHTYYHVPLSKILDYRDLNNLGPFLYPKKLEESFLSEWQLQDWSNIDTDFGIGEKLIGKPVEYLLTIDMLEHIGEIIDKIDEDSSGYSILIEFLKEKSLYLYQSLVDFDEQGLLLRILEFAKSDILTMEAKVDVSNAFDEILESIEKITNNFFQEDQMEVKDGSIMIPAEVNFSSLAQIRIAAKSLSENLTVLIFWFLGKRLELGLIDDQTLK